MRIADFTRPSSARRWVWLAFVLVLLSGAVSGQEQDQEFSEEDLFGAETALVTDAAPESAAPEDGLMRTETVKVGGEFAMEFAADGDPADSLEPSTDLSLTLYADARPDDRLRVLVKGDLAYPFAEGDDYVLREAFADLTPAEGLFLRAGKQTANWGVGYFFSPANLLNLESVDPENPEAELTGPLAAKLHLPRGGDNYYLYVLLDEAAAGGPAALAPKAEWTRGNAEFGLGGLWQQDAPWALMATLSATLGGIDFFGEAVLRGNEDRLFIVSDTNAPTGIAAETRSDELFPQAAVGFSWSRSEEEDVADFSFVAQYYYNGLGYEDQDFVRSSFPAIAPLVASGVLPAADLMERGRHYGAVNLSMADMADADFGVSLFWLGNLADASGKARITLTWDRLDRLRLSAAYTYAYGAEYSEYAPTGAAPELALRVSVVQATF